MNELIYEYNNTDHSFIWIGYTNKVKFNDILWNDIKVVVCFITYTFKKVYKFILKLPKLKMLCFRGIICTYLITYNIKFFKHKLLKMYHRTLDMHIKPNIIFIL